MTVLPHDVHGTGEHRVLALHGWFGDRTAFRAITPHLDESAFTYVIPDCRGYGAAKDADGEFSTDEVAADAIALADHLGWDTFSVIGHSMGGKAAQRVVTLAPERVRKLVGISPVPASGVPFDADTAAFFAGAATDPAIRRAIIDRSTGNRLPGRWLDGMVEQSLACANTAAFAAYLPHWSADDFHELVDGAEVPALGIVGAHDPDLSADAMNATWMKWFPRAELCVLADAGHYAMDETPLALVSVVEGFLA
ncbi:MAG TPA: alpha/beta hydrolase [Micromonosporaceae bacterium]